MNKFSEILYRDESMARIDDKNGMHHSGYWSSLFRTVLASTDNLTAPHHTNIDTVSTGAHHFEFRDPVTGSNYEVIVKPASKRK